MKYDPIVALEIGTSKTVAVVGEIDESEELVIQGIGEAPSVGVRKSEAVNIEKATNVLRTAIEAATASSKIEINEVYLVIGGGHIQSVSNKGFTVLRSREVEEEDIDAVIDYGKTINLPPERLIIHSFEKGFNLDGHVVEDPVGMSGSKLEIEMLLIHGIRTRIDNSKKIVENIELSVKDTAFSGVCSAISTLSPEEKQGGIILIDMGGGTTNYVACKNGHIIDAGVLAVGGDNITVDISEAFKISFSQAEQLKKTFGCMSFAASYPEGIKVVGEVGLGERNINASSLATVVNARLSETFEIIRGKIQEKDPDLLSQMNYGLGITGGGSKLIGIEKVAEKVFDLNCFKLSPRELPGKKIEGPEYSTCLGMLGYAFTSEIRRNKKKKNIIERIFG